MPHPPRLAHLVNRRVAVAKLTATYAAAHAIDALEGAIRLDRALTGPLQADLLDATWEALRAGKPRLSEEALLERVAEYVKEHGPRESKAAPITSDWSAFLVAADLAAGTASESARRILESVEGSARVRAGLQAAGRFLAAELLRK